MGKGLLIAGVVVVGAGAYWLYRKNADAAASDQKGSGPGGVDCDKMGHPYAIAICKGYNVVNDALNGLRDWDKVADAENIRLNGEIAVPLDPGIKAGSTCPGSVGSTPGSTSSGGASSPTRPMIWGTVQEFKNGCQPFDGAPGRDKCAPGTKSMVTPNCQTNMVGGPFHKFGVPSTNENKFATAILRGRPGDPFTFGPYTNKSTGESYAYVLGKKVVCPQGQTIDTESTAFVRDHITGKTTAQTKCHKPGEPVQFGSGPGNKIPPKTGPLPDDFVWVGDGTGPTHTQIGGAPGTPPPGFHWVVDHWERDRAA